MSSTPVLIFTSMNESFFVYCDAYLMGHRGVLMQNRQVVAYTSSELKVHERNHPTHDLELTAVAFMLKI